MRALVPCAGGHRQCDWEAGASSGVQHRRVRVVDYCWIISMALTWGLSAPAL
jgi:hypothetical protein